MFIPGVAIPQLTHVLQVFGEERRLEDLVHGGFAFAGGRANLHFMLKVN